MAAIVLAFAPEDRAAGDAVGEALAAAGYDVQTSPPPSARSWLTRRAAEAQAVVVLWSRHAPGSPALIRQAAQARRVGKLVAVRLDAAPRPVGLGRGVGAVDLRAHDGIDALLAKLAAPSTPAPAPAASKSLAPARAAAETVAPPENAATARPRKHASAWLLIAGAALLTATLGAAILLR